MDNERVAMLNKYYESGFFNIPIFVANNTYVSDRVLENKMGWSINTDENGISEFLDKISIDLIINCHRNIKK